MNADVGYGQLAINLHSAEQTSLGKPDIYHHRKKRNCNRL